MSSALYRPGAGPAPALYPTLLRSASAAGQISAHIQYMQCLRCPVWAIAHGLGLLEELLNLELTGDLDGHIYQ